MVLNTRNATSNSIGSTTLGTGYNAEEFARKIFQEWHFSMTVIDNYSNNKSYIQVNSPDELTALFKGPVEHLNLFLEKRMA